MSTEPSQGVEKDSARDVLAAEAFAVPTADPALRRHPVELPEDPSGIAEPHDILAAEEFAMPAGPAGGSPGPSREARRWVAAAAALGGLLALLRRLRRR